MDCRTPPEAFDSDRALRIVLVEDEGSARTRHSSEQLTSVPEYELPVNEFTIVRANSFAHALAACSDVRPDTILVKLDVPDQEGIERIRRLRQAQPHTPVIALFGTANEELRNAALAGGAQSVLGTWDSQGAWLARSIRHTIENWRLQEERLAMAALLMCLPDGILVVDLGGQVLFVNRAAEKLFGTSLEDFAGSLAGLAADGKATSQFTVVRGGETRPVDLWAIDFLWKNTQSRLAVVRELSPREAPLSDDPAGLSTTTLKPLAFRLAGIAHDVVNLLTVVTGGVDLIRKRPIQPYVEEILTDMQLAVDRATDLNKQLMAFAKESVITGEPCDLVALVRAAEGMLRRLAGGGVHLTAEIGAQPCIVEANEAQVTQIILNLVVNARDAVGPCGHITICVNRCTIDDPAAITTGQLPAGNYAVVSVRDDGKGIDDSTQSRIFQPLFTTKNGHGSGLGLAVVFELVRQNGGFIDVVSEVGKGSTFSVYFPLTG